jgi:hypothetical protein
LRHTARGHAGGRPLPESPSVAFALAILADFRRGAEHSRSNLGQLALKFGMILPWQPGRGNAGSDDAVEGEARSVTLARSHSV